MKNNRIRYIHKQEDFDLSDIIVAQNEKQVQNVKKRIGNNFELLLRWRMDQYINRFSQLVYVIERFNPDINLDKEYKKFMTYIQSFQNEGNFILQKYSKGKLTEENMLILLGVLYRTANSYADDLMKSFGLDPNKYPYITGLLEEYIRSPSTTSFPQQLRNELFQILNYQEEIPINHIAVTSLI